MATPKNFLHLWDDRFLYITPAIQSGLTARSSATVLASVSGHPFMLEAADEVVRVRVLPGWLRIDARFGSVFRRRGDPVLLLR
jgi:hypothetical protein